MEWIFWPIWLTLVATNNSEYLETFRSQDAIAPETITQAVALCAIPVWAILAKCSFAVHIWAYLAAYHTPNIDLSTAHNKRLSGRWFQFLYLFMIAGYVGMIAFAIIYNTTTFGLASAPWILSAMIAVFAIGCWKIQKRIV